MRGVTLIELVVAMLVLGLLAGLAAVALGSLRPPPVDPWQAQAAGARQAAIRSGRPVVVRGNGDYRALLLPDGRAVGPGLDPLTGEAHHDPR